MFPQEKLFSILVTGLIISSVLALHFLLINNDRNLMPAPCVTDILDNVMDKENAETRPMSYAEKLFKLYDGVETFVMFIGYPRSSHSLVSAILDAHPEIVIPHEYNLLAKWPKFQSAIATRKNMRKYLLFYELQQLSMKQALFGIRANKNSTLLRGEYTYTYNVPGLWQGGYQDRIKVIGDKKGGKTSMILSNQDSMEPLEKIRRAVKLPLKIIHVTSTFIMLYKVIGDKRGGSTSMILFDQDSMEPLEKIRRAVKLPLKIIHVTRNPFDNIASMMLRSTGNRNAVDNRVQLDRAISVYFKLAAANQRVRESYGEVVIDIPGHETVLRPRETIRKLCDHLGVTCSDDYLDKCSKIMYGAPSVTRDKVVWTEEQKTRVTQMMKGLPFLKDYSFDEYPK